MASFASASASAPTTGYPNLHVAIEGNVGVGKSTFISKIAEILTNRGYTNFQFPEPITEWISFGPEGENLLQKMYESKDYSYIFQTVAYLTKIEQLRHKGAFRIVERTLLAQLKVFLPLLLKENRISRLEYTAASRLIQTMVSDEYMKPHFVVYLTSRPEICLERIKTRGRVEESKITLEYLSQIQQLYDQWLLTELAEHVMIVHTDTPFSLDYEKITDDLLKRLHLPLQRMQGGVGRTDRFTRNKPSTSY